MLTKEDIKLLTDYQADVFRGIFASKEDIARLENKINILQTAVDSLAKMVKDFRDEHIIIHKRLEVLEDWAKQVSKKIGISLPF